MKYFITLKVSNLKKMKELKLSPAEKNMANSWL